MRRILEWRIWCRWGEINTRDFCEPDQWGQWDPRKHLDTVISREVTSALELRAETTFLLVPLPDHKRKKSTLKKHFPPFPFFLTSDFPPLRKFTTSKREFLYIQIQVDALLFYKNCLNFTCSFVCFNTPNPTKKAIHERFASLYDRCDCIVPV